MSIDVLPSCSSASALFDQFSAQLAAASASNQPSSPPSRCHRNNGGSKKFEANANAAEFRFIQNAVAMAVLARLHRWCCQLFWLTIVCLIGVCSDTQQKGSEAEQAQQTGGDKQQANRVRTFQEVRKSIVQASQRRGCKTLHELEMQLLRHLTCPQTAVLRPLRPTQHKKRHFLSRPPSPQLFDISEEAE